MYGLSKGRHCYPTPVVQHGGKFPSSDPWPGTTFQCWARDPLQPSRAAVARSWVLCKWDCTSAPSLMEIYSNSSAWAWWGIWCSSILNQWKSWDTTGFDVVLGTFRSTHHVALDWNSLGLGTVWVSPLPPWRWPRVGLASCRRGGAACLGVWYPKFPSS